MVKLSGGGLNSNKVVQSKHRKQEPISHKGSPAGISQAGVSTAFPKEPITKGKGYEPKGPTSNLGQGPGANRVIHPSGSQQKTPAPKEMEKGRDILSEYGRDIPGRR